MEDNSQPSKKRKIISKSAPSKRIRVTPLRLSVPAISSTLTTPPLASTRSSTQIYSPSQTNKRRSTTQVYASTKKYTPTQEQTYSSSQVHPSSQKPPSQKPPSQKPPSQKPPSQKPPSNQVRSFSQKPLSSQVRSSSQKPPSNQVHPSSQKPFSSQVRPSLQTPSSTQIRSPVPTQVSYALSLNSFLQTQMNAQTQCQQNIFYDEWRCCSFGEELYKNFIRRQPINGRPLFGDNQGILDICEDFDIIEHCCMCHGYAKSKMRKCRAGQYKDSGFCELHGGLFPLCAAGARITGGERCCNLAKNGIFCPYHDPKVPKCKVKVTNATGGPCQGLPEFQGYCKYHKYLANKN